MKKSLLFLGLLGFAGVAQAQTPTPIVMGPWTQVNVNNYQTFAPGYIVTHVTTVSPTACWAVTDENTATGVARSFLKTSNATGTEFDFGGISANGANSSYQAANISPVGASTTTAVVGMYGTPSGGEILRTTNGGASWTLVSTFAANSFLDFVHMFDNQVGVAMGDPTNGYFEILRTTDGGLTWNRIPQANIPPLLNANEYGLVHSFFARGNTIWFGGASSNDNDPVRVFKSTDRGLTWTASPVTTLTGTISKLAFRDDLNGIAYNVKVTGTTATAVNLIRTTDGGATWSPITPANGPSGNFFRADIDAVNGRFYSVGPRFPRSTPSVNADFGSSYSTDGINWTNISTLNALVNEQSLTAIDVIASPGSTTSAVGYAGSFTDPDGVGGMYKTSQAIPLATATRDASLQMALSVYPNPSNTGLFTVDLGSTLKAGAVLTVSDALGRQVKTQELTATNVGSKKLNLDLSGEKTGVYTLQIRTDAGIATQKVVIN